MKIAKATRRGTVFLPPCHMLTLHHLAQARGLALPVLLALNIIKVHFYLLSIFSASFSSSLTSALLMSFGHVTVLPTSKICLEKWWKKANPDLVKLNLKQTPILLVTLVINSAESLFPKGAWRLRDGFDYLSSRHPSTLYVMLVPYGKEHSLQYLWDVFEITAVSKNSNTVHCVDFRWLLPST